MPSYGSTAEMSLNEDDIEELVNFLCEAGMGRPSLLFQIKANREIVYQRAKARGAVLHRSVIRNQQLDPRYTVENRKNPDLGLANDYRHFFGTLYELERTL